MIPYPDFFFFTYIIASLVIKGINRKNVTMISENKGISIYVFRLCDDSEVTIIYVQCGVWIMKDFSFSSCL